MKVRNLLFASAIALGCFSAAAQQAEGTTEYIFLPHWYGQVQVGGQETLGETSFGKLLSPNVQIGAGYQFHQLWGLRLSVNGWTSKASLELNEKRHNWKWNYVAPMADITFNLSHFICGYNPTRHFDVNIFAGIGANVGFNNDEAQDVNAIASRYGRKVLADLWDGTKVRLTARFGAAVDYRFNSKWAIGLELQANTLSDTYNSKHAGNADWYFNGYVGVKYTFGESHGTKFIPAPAPEVIYQERIVERVVEVPAECPDAEQIITEYNQTRPMVRNIFFTISNAKISLWEMTKVEEIAEYLNERPNATVTITGYADKGTGSKAINLRLSKQRAEVVANTLVNKFGIDRSRITVESMTYDAPDQPFATPELNRVAICVAE